MKKETIFTSDDGIRFDTEEECLEWERLLPTFRKIREEIREELEFREGPVRDSDCVGFGDEGREDLSAWMELHWPMGQSNAAKILGRCREIIEMADRLRRPQ